MTANPLTIAIVGVPAPQGSKTGVVRGNRAILIEGGSQTGRDKHRAWRDACAAGGWLLGIHWWCPQAGCGRLIPTALTSGNSVRWAPPRVDLTPTPEVDQATALGLPVDDRWLTDRDAA